MVVNDTRIYWKTKKKSWLNIEKMLQNEKRRPTKINIRHKGSLFFW